MSLLCVCCIDKTSDVQTKVNLRASNSSDNIVAEEIKGAYLELLYNRFDIGTVSRRMNPYVLIELKFVNSGKIPLVILKADVSCGCVSVEYPKEAILPGHTNIFKIKVDLRAQEGLFNKTVFIKSNADNAVVLVRIVGEIKK